MPEPALSRIAVRGFAQPIGHRPKRRRNTRVGFPSEATIVTTLRQPLPYEPVLLAAVADLVSEQGPLLPPRFVVPAGSPIDPEALAQVTGDLPLDHAAFLRMLFKRYKERSCLVGFRLPWHLSALAVDWAPSGKDGIGLILWTRPAPAARSAADARRRPILANGEIENGYRPRLRLQPMGADRASIKFLGRRDPDPAEQIPEGHTKPKPGYRFPGYFLDLAAATYATTGSRPSGLAEAGHLFDLDLSDAATVSGSEPTAELLASVERELADMALLYRAVMQAHRDRLPRR
jgi:hypothetical protein